MVDVEEETGWLKGPRRVLNAIACVGAGAAEIRAPQAATNPILAPLLANSVLDAIRLRARTAEGLRGPLSAPPLAALTADEPAVPGNGALWPVDGPFARPHLYRSPSCPAQYANDQQLLDAIPANATQVRVLGVLMIDLVPEGVAGPSIARPAVLVGCADHLITIVCDAPFAAMEAHHFDEGLECKQADAERVLFPAPLNGGNGSAAIRSATRLAVRRLMDERVPPRFKHGEDNMLVHEGVAPFLLLRPPAGDAEEKACGDALLSTVRQAQRIGPSGFADSIRDNSSPHHHLCHAARNYLRAHAAAARGITLRTVFFAGPGLLSVSGDGVDGALRPEVPPTGPPLDAATRNALFAYPRRENALGVAIDVAACVLFLAEYDAPERIECPHSDAMEAILSEAFLTLCHGDQLIADSRAAQPTANIAPPPVPPGPAPPAPDEAPRVQIGFGDSDDDDDEVVDAVEQKDVTAFDASHVPALRIPPLVELVDAPCVVVGGDVADDHADVDATCATTLFKAVAHVLGGDSQQCDGIALAASSRLRKPTINLGHGRSTHRVARVLSRLPLPPEMHLLVIPLGAPTRLDVMHLHAGSFAIHGRDSALRIARDLPTVVLVCQTIVGQGPSRINAPARIRIARASIRLGPWKRQADLDVRIREFLAAYTPAPETREQASSATMDDNVDHLATRVATQVAAQVATQVATQVAVQMETRQAVKRTRPEIAEDHRLDEELRALLAQS